MAPGVVLNQLVEDHMFRVYQYVLRAFTDGSVNSKARTATGGPFSTALNVEFSGRINNATSSTPTDLSGQRLALEHPVYPGCHSYGLSRCSSAARPP